MKKYILNIIFREIKMKTFLALFAVTIIAIFLTSSNCLADETIPDYDYATTTVSPIVESVEEVPVPPGLPKPQAKKALNKKIELNADEYKATLKNIYTEIPPHLIGLRLENPENINEINEINITYKYTHKIFKFYDFDTHRFETINPGLYCIIKISVTDRKQSFVTRNTVVNDSEIQVVFNEAINIVENLLNDRRIKK